MKRVCAINGGGAASPRVVWVRQKTARRRNDDAVAGLEIDVETKLAQVRREALAGLGVVEMRTATGFDVERGGAEQILDLGHLLRAIGSATHRFDSPGMMPMLASGWLSAHFATVRAPGERDHLLNVAT
jgi:hypothetical protein